MLADAEVRSFVRRITYKPGWSFKIREAQARPETAAEPMLYMSFHGESSRPGEGMIDVGWGEVLTSYDRGNVGALRNAVYRIIRNFEEHERDEWFALDGVLVKDPHGGTNVKVRTDQEGVEYKTIRVPAAQPSYVVDL